MPTVEVKGGTLFYRECGAGEPLVLVHGTGASADVWEKVLFPLSTQYRVLAYDRRGHQRSKGTRSDHGSHYLQHGEDLLELLTHADARPATIVGWGSGAFAALHMVLRSPTAARQLVLYEPPFHARREMTWQAFKASALSKLGKVVGLPDFGADQFRRVAMAYCYGDNTFDNLSDRLRASMLKDTAALLHELAAGTGEDLVVQDLARISAPVKLLCGQHSPDFFRTPMRRLQSVFPRAPVTTIPGANHFAHVDCPAAFVRSLSAALRLQ